MRCGGRLVELGMTKSEVAARCGAPSHQTMRYEERAVDGRRELVTVDEWTYLLGPGTFPRLLEFRNNRLVSLRAGRGGL
ncbi:DUF2845 domain-containing protein [Sorangium sp. So ce385]|uniref:DUF2845 domain-containing protein n=1 Tax=Sorangium sp. So ce385 TaxID=3133308 RepID=UPI003F5B7D75